MGGIPTRADSLGADCPVPIDERRLAEGSQIVEVDKYGLENRSGFGILSSRWGYFLKSFRTAGLWKTHARRTRE